MSILDEYRRKRIVTTEPKFKIIQEGERRIFSRIENGGFERRLGVWSSESCDAKVNEKLRQGGRKAVDEMIKDFASSLGKYESSPFFHGWWTECWEQMVAAYDRAFPPVVAPDDTIELFGEEIEEFGA